MKQLYYVEIVVSPYVTDSKAHVPLEDVKVFHDVLAAERYLKKQGFICNHNWPKKRTDIIWHGIKYNESDRKKLYGDVYVCYLMD